MSNVYTRCLDCTKLYCYKSIIDHCQNCGSYNLIDEIYDEMPVNCNHHSKDTNVDELINDSAFG